VARNFRPATARISLQIPRFLRARSGIGLASAQERVLQIMKITKVLKTNLFKDEQTTLAVLAIILAIAALWAIGCGGGGGSYSTSTPTSPTSTPSPTSTTPTPAGGVTVNIVGNAGSVAFSPNPAQAPAGSTIIWKNTTSAQHHLVMNDGTLIGDIAPGTSLTMTLNGSGGSYHCTVHPTMVGSINGASAPPDPMPNPGGGYSY
jgi:plastocyanin